METKQEQSLVLNASEYGIEESKAKQLESIFVPMVEKFKELEKEYNQVLSNSEITKEVCENAKVVRLKYQKVRTGADAIHKDAKASLLVQTRAIDGLRNIIKYAVIDHEDSLKEVENHFERIEEEKREKLREERKAEIEKYETDPGVGDLAMMSNDVWKHYINSVKSGYEQRKEAERKAEEERIARERAEREEQERIRKENKRLKKEAEERGRLAKIEAEKRAKEEAKRKAKEEAERKAREEKERKKREAYEAKLKYEREEKERIERAERIKREKIEAELKRKEEAERRAKAEEEARVQKELSKRDADKVKDLISDLESLKTKYSFKSAKNKKMYADVSILIDKVINHINK